MGCASSQVEFEHGSLIHEEQTTADDQMSRIVEVAFSEEEFNDLWNYFNFEEEHPTVDFEKSGIIIAQTLENSCPKEIEILKFDNTEENLIIDTMQKETICEDIGFPRTFIFQADKEKLEKVKTIIFEGEEFTLESYISLIFIISLLK